MSAIFKYLQEFYQKEFKLAYFLAVLLLLGIYIYLNYWHALEIRLAAGGKTKWNKFLGYYLLYFIPFALAFFLQLFFYKDCHYYRNLWFWIILLLAPAFFSFRINFDFHQQFIKNIRGGDAQIFWMRCLNWVVRVFVLLIPVFIIWWIKDRDSQPFYGYTETNMRRFKKAMNKEEVSESDVDWKDWRRAPHHSCMCFLATAERWSVLSTVRPL